MASFHHTAKKSGTRHRHSMELHFSSRDVQALAPRLNRELMALRRKFERLVRAAKKRAARRMRQQGTKGRRARRSR